MVSCELQELLYNKHLNIDGTRIESTGFTYQHSTLELTSMREVRRYWVNTSMREVRRYWVNTSMREVRRYWVNTRRR